MLWLSFTQGVLIQQQDESDPDQGFLIPTLPNWGTIDNNVNIRIDWTINNETVLWNCLVPRPENIVSSSDPCRSRRQQMAIVFLSTIRCRPGCPGHEQNRVAFKDNQYQSIGLPNILLDLSSQPSSSLTSSSLTQRHCHPATKQHFGIF